MAFQYFEHAPGVEWGVYGNYQLRSTAQQGYGNHGLPQVDAQANGFGNPPQHRSPGIQHQSSGFGLLGEPMPRDFIDSWNRIATGVPDQLHVPTERVRAEIWWASHFDARHSEKNPTGPWSQVRQSPGIERPRFGVDRGRRDLQWPSNPFQDRHTLGDREGGGFRRWDHDELVPFQPVPLPHQREELYGLPRKLEDCFTRCSLNGDGPSSRDVPPVEEAGTPTFISRGSSQWDTNGNPPGQPVLSRNPHLLSHARWRGSNSSSESSSGEVAEIPPRTVPDPAKGQADGLDYKTYGMLGRPWEYPH